MVDQQKEPPSQAQVTGVQEQTPSHIQSPSHTSSKSKNYVSYGTIHVGCALYLHYGFVYRELHMPFTVHGLQNG